MMLKNDRDHTHADFSNHRSHLGIFASSLSNFSADLDDSVRQINTGSARWQQQQRQHAETGTDIKIDTTESTDTLTETYSEGRHEEYIFGEAGEFLKSQQKRLHNIEKQLLSRIEDILPVESDLMTATELVQACQRLHSVNVGFAQHLGSIHKLRGDTNEYGSTNQNEVPIPNTASRPTFRNGSESAPVSNKQPSRSQPLAPQFSTRGPLLQVAETDYETDATSTTPATIMQRKDDSQIMRENPDRAHLDSDSAIVPFQNRVYSASPGVDLIEAWRSRQSMNCGMENVDNHPISDSVFTQSTDCIPKDDHSGVAPREPSNDTYSGQDDSFASRGDCSSQFSRANTTAMCDDESVSLAPTVKGRGFFKRQALEQLRYGLDLVDTSHEQQQRELESDRQSEAPFSELVVNEDASESFQNNDLTFDRSMLNEQSMSSPTRSRIYEVGDESLLVTPVLARYRLEPDDSSIGVRVVPRDAVSGQARFPLPGKNRNFLAAHTQRENHAAATAAAAANESRNKHEKPIQQKSTPREKENVLNRIDERALLSPNVSVRTPQKYGKFDFDEDVVGAFKLNHSTEERENRHHIDERALLSPNVSVRTPQKVRNFEFDHENLTGTFKMEHPIEERKNLSAKRKPSLSGVVAEATCRETGLTHHSEEMAMRRQTVDAAPSKVVKVEAFAIAVISFEEYDSAPSVIRMQVGVEEINASVHVLNLWFKANGSQQKGSPRLNEDTAARVLHTSSKRAKIVLMSLCHWRRLNMYMEESTSLMYFVPNQKQRSPRLTL